MNLEPGYYATLDPDDSAVTTCWRWSTNRGLRRWSGGATYGEATRPSRGRPHRPITIPVRLAYAAWFEQVLAAITADPAAARLRFAEITTCCLACGKKLTDPQSIAAGLGPDCRRESAA
jgi:hypothetical protein